MQPMANRLLHQRQHKPCAGLRHGLSFLANHRGHLHAMALLLWVEEILHHRSETQGNHSIRQRKCEQTFWFQPWFHFVVRIGFRPQYLVSQKPPRSKWPGGPEA